MRLVEIITEASKAEKARRAKLSAQSKRAAANSAATPPPPPPNRRKGIPSNVPDVSNYITNKPLRQQQAAFAGSEFDQFREPEPDPTENKGVVLRFHTEKRPKTGNTLVYGYWAHDYALDFNDSKNFGNIRLVDFLYSQDTVDLVDELVNKEHNVHIFIDPSINKQFPKEAKQLGRWANSKKVLNKYQGSVNFEIDDTPEQSKPASAPVNVPTADLRIPNAQALEQQLMTKIRANKYLSAKFSEADPATKSAALQAGVVDLHKFKDIDAALDAVDVALD